MYLLSAIEKCSDKVFRTPKVRRETHLENVGPVFEFLESRFRFLKSQELKRIPWVCEILRMNIFQVHCAYLMTCIIRI